VAVSDKEILEAMGYLFSDTHNVAEGAGASALAAILKERPVNQEKVVGMVLTGGNITGPLFAQALASLQKIT
ncbi:MAG: hypothetical protein HUJ31_00175, partial [Pseudomonadales bacterium]|nr:hypothetical protein [Pseudomonadales bacterium]